MAEDLGTKAAYWLVLTACPDAVSAERLAETLVRRNLAACVNIQPQVRSIYRWRGRIESSGEHLLLIKTAAARYRELQDVIEANHPYELPEVIAVPIVAGSGEYLSWLHQTVCEPS
ncbi:MAG: Divalent-cation tolerance protein CutA [Gammaproteobacteria bacterium]|nr:Divalent-cation tolerance protein CutA [Gammaproteobacteria bacterium]